LLHAYIGTYVIYIVLTPVRSCVPHVIGVKLGFILTMPA
jgi:hypothetical protein